MAPRRSDDVDTSTYISAHRYARIIQSVLAADLAGGVRHGELVRLPVTRINDERHQVFLREEVLVLGADLNRLVILSRRAKDHSATARRTIGGDRLHTRRLALQSEIAIDHQDLLIIRHAARVCGRVQIFLRALGLWRFFKIPCGERRPSSS